MEPINNRQVNHTRNPYARIALLFSFCLSHLAFIQPSFAGPESSSSGGAKLYSCVDAHGRRYTSDTPIAECKQRAVNMLDKNGLVRKTIAPPKTDQEIQQEIDAQKKAKTSPDEQQQELSKKLLKIRYPNENALIAAREKALKPIEQEIFTSQAHIKELEEEDMEISKLPNSTEQKSKQALIRRQLQIEQSLLESRRTYWQKIDTQFKQDLERYQFFFPAKSSK